MGIELLALLYRSTGDTQTSEKWEERREASISAMELGLQLNNLPLLTLLSELSPLIFKLSTFWQ